MPALRRRCACSMTKATPSRHGKKLLASGPASELIALTCRSGKTSRWAYDERGRLSTILHPDAMTRGTFP